ncbi:MAG: SDR family oxidoreductase [Anaerolineales bacterium]|jgi:3-dehydrosphinganine reductase
MNFNGRVNFRGKVVLITGGSSGIGLATAVALADQGSHVWLLARREEQLKNALAEVESHRQSEEQFFGVLFADVSDVDQVNAAVNRVIAKSGVPDLVIASAGVVEPGYFQDLDLEDFHWMMDVNYFGSVYLTKAVLPGMLERKSGHLVYICSAGGFVGVVGYTGYSGSKFALRGFSDTLRSELKPLGIDVSIVFPTDTDTPQLEYDNRHKPPEWGATNAVPNAMAPEAVAQAILRGVARGHYMILPGAGTKFYYWLTSLLGPLWYPILDLLVVQARRNYRKHQAKALSDQHK